MTLDDDLRQTLREHAEETTSQPDLLTAVRGGLRRSNRRRAAVAGAAALLIVAVAVPVALAGGGPGPQPAPAGSADPTAGWERPRLELPVFPLTPAWTPPGAGAATVGRLGPNVLLTYEQPRLHIEVEVGPEPGDWWVEGPQRPVSGISDGSVLMRSHPAADYEGLHPDDAYVGLQWKLPDGRWVQLNSEGAVTEKEILRFADGLRRRDLAATATPFTVATAPAGLVLQRMLKQDLCLAPPAGLGDRGENRGICISIGDRTPPDEQPADDLPVTVGGRPGWLSVGDDGPVGVTVPLDARRSLLIDLRRSDLPLTRTQLLRFAAGVTVNPS